MSSLVPYGVCRLLGAGLLAAALSFAQEPVPASAEPQSEKPTDSDNSVKSPTDPEAVAATPPPAPAPGQNLLGQADTARGEGRRNENVQISLVDNNAARDANQRVGATATIVEEFRVDRSYFSAEFGGPAMRGPIHAQAQDRAGIHGNVFWNHGNSVFSARAFFQVGAIKPARQNQFGAALTIGLWKGAFFSFNGSQDKNSGNVNGNILIPLPEEREPLATDPALRAVVQRLIDAYPNVVPNLNQRAPRQHNANSPQLIETDLANGQLNQKLGSRDTLISRFTFTAQRVDAFQFVKGQNPDTRIKSHSARMTWDRAWNASTVGDVSIGFDRQATLLVPAKDAVGPVFINGLTQLGPQNNIPIDRAINQFRFSASAQARRNTHVLTAGAGATRIQYNGNEPDGMRPVWTMREDFGNSSITNLRLGRPYQLSQSFGEPYRAFRNWELQIFAGDHWAVNNRLTLSLGVRYEPVTRPDEVTGLGAVPYDSDWNNVGGTFGFAYRMPSGLGVLRGAYGVMFGQIFPATYGQLRMNPPYYIRVNLQAPDMLNPYAKLTASAMDPANGRGSRFEVSPDLATPYSHQYNFSWEAEIHAGWRLQLGYVGSRSQKLYQNYIFNRARFVPGISFISATINERRPNPLMTERFLTGNFSRGYYDAGRVSLVVPRWRGATISASYWFSKAIDLGADYVSTGGGNERYGSGGQTEFNTHNEMKAVSGFDQPHAFLLQTAYDTGRRGPGWFGRIFRNWNLSAVYLRKSGTPFSVQSGADGPGLGNVDGSNGDRPMLVDPTILGRTIGNPDTSEELLPRTAFRFINAPAEMAGNLGRNTFRKGMIANLNASLGRSWTLPHDLQMSLRAESINLFNTPQFAEPGSQLASPNFGQITNTLNDGRTFRFVMRFVF